MGNGWREPQDGSQVASHSCGYLLAAPHWRSVVREHYISHRIGTLGEALVPPKQCNAG
jgi:hypothetical protein